MPRTLVKTCPACGRVAAQSPIVCLGCGHYFRTSPPALPAPERRSATHSVVLALLLSVLPGTGQVYNRQPAKGLALLLGAVVAGLVIYGVYPLSHALGSTLLGLALPCFLIASTRDADRIARRIRRGETVRPWQWF